MSIYAHIKRCLELSDKDIASAIGDRRLTKALLDQLAKVSKPGDGAPKLLLVFAKMAEQQVDWVDGALRIEMAGDGDATVVEVLTELGLGMHERVFPSIKMAVPLEEFARAVERVPHMIAPLAIATTAPRRLVLAANADDEVVDPSEEMPAAVEIGDDSLYGSAGYETVEKAKKGGPSPFVKIDPAPKRTMSSGKHRAVKRASKPAPDLEATKRADFEAATVPRVISPTTGKTLRPAPMKVKSGPPPLPASEAKKAESVKPAKRESVRPAKRESAKPAKREGSQPPPSSKTVVPKPPPLPRVEAKPAGSAIARVALTKMAAPQRIAARPAVEKRRSTKPPPPKRASKAPAKSVPPKTAKAAKVMSEPPDEEGIDMGWEDD